MQVTSFTWIIVGVSYELWPNKPSHLQAHLVLPPPTLLLILLLSPMNTLSSTILFPLPVGILVIL